jgi:hypothetical protein
MVFKISGTEQSTNYEYVSSSGLKVPGMLLTNSEDLSDMEFSMFMKRIVNLADEANSKQVA